VQYLQRQLKDKKYIVVCYILKTISQFIVIVVAIVTNFSFFQNFDSTFTCEDSTQNHRFENVTCSYSKLQYISFLRVVDFILLALLLIALIFGLYWCSVGHLTLAYKEVAEFTYQYGILGKHYIDYFSKWRRFCNWIPLKCSQRVPFRDDLCFTVFVLSLTNAGLGRLFKSIQEFNDLLFLFNDDIKSSQLQDKKNDGMCKLYIIIQPSTKINKKCS